MKYRNIKHKDDWATPNDLYKKLDLEFKFEFDPCPYKHDMSWDGLTIEWKTSNYINPPYSKKLKEAFIIKAILESRKNKLCVMLIPVSTSTKIFHNAIKPNATEIRFIKGRIKFKGELSYTTAMHDSMIVIFDGRNKLYNIDLTQNQINQQ